MEKLGIALGGGGSRGAYQVGVWRALLENGIQADLVTGTSVGALNGALMVQGDYEQALRLWNRLTVEDVANVDISRAMEAPDPGRAVYAEFLKQAVREGGVDISGLESLMRSVVDEERFFSAPVGYGLVTVEYPSLRPVVLSKESIPRGSLCDYLIASASCFPAFPTRLIGGARYIDGAFHDNLPINLAVTMGATAVLAVDLEGPGLKKKPRDKNIPVTLVRPVHPLGPFLMFEPDSAHRNIELGYLDALRALGKAEGEWITLRPGTAAQIEDALRPAVFRATSLIGTPPQEAGFWDGLLSRTAKTQRIEGRIPQIIQLLAEWYGLDDEVLYTAHTFCYELLLHFNASEPLASAEIADASGAGRSTLEKLRAFGHQRLTGHIFSRLRDLSFGRGDRAEMLRLAAALGDETAAAVFLFALKRHLAGEWE